MSNADEIRWQQRHNNLKNALGRLKDACELDDYSELELAGLIQTFEFSFELAWNTLKDLLFYEGFEVKTPRQAIRTSFDTEYIDEDDFETMIDALEQRNLMRHIYDEEEALAAVELIKEQYQPLLERLSAYLETKREA